MNLTAFDSANNVLVSQAVNTSLQYQLLSVSSTCNQIAKVQLLSLVPVNDAWDHLTFERTSLTIGMQPSSVRTCLNGTTIFSVTTSGTGPFTYQWLKNGTPIDPLLNPSAATDTLTLSDITVSDIASYDCIVTNSCGSVTSNPATLTICPGDFNCDGGIDGSDIESFFNDWEAGNASADINEDGGIDGSDVEVFFGRWEAGC